MPFLDRLRNKCKRWRVRIGGEGQHDVVPHSRTPTVETRGYVGVLSAPADPLSLAPIPCSDWVDNGDASEIEGNSGVALAAASAAPPLPSCQGRDSSDEIIPIVGFIDVMPQPLPNQPQPAPIHPVSLSTLYAAPTDPLSSLSYFAGAHHLHIPQLNVNNVRYQGSWRTLFDYLEPHVAHGAAHNSDERCGAPKCYPGTRTAIQEGIVGWMAQKDDARDEPKRIMWLSGPAGSGKTAIAGSVAETCNRLGLLAASFFFSSSSGSEDRRSKRCFITTIANHLAEHEALREYKIRLLWSIERQPGIFRKNLKEQAEYLILNPLREIQGQYDSSDWPRGMVLDGLDEVEAGQCHEATKQAITRTHDDEQLEILEVLFTLSQDPAFPFRIFIASRPERTINEFSRTIAASSTITLFLDAKYDPDTDIRGFLDSKFASIKRRSGISDSSWPSREAVNWMVEKSAGQFAIPAAITRYVGGGLPRQRLEEVIQAERTKSLSTNPFAPIDALYSDVLKRSPNPPLAILWIRSMLAVYPSVGSESLPAQFWRYFLETEEGETAHLLGDLASLISVPSTDDPTSPFDIYHRSAFIDFLGSERRCGDFFIGAATVNSFVASRCVNVLQAKGPSRSLPSGELARFLDHFLDLSPFVHEASSEDLFGPKCPRFLSFLDDSSKDVLASCDVAWWTHLLLTGILGGNRQCPDADIYETLQSHAILRGIYCGIHDICLEGQSCHPACTRWRTEIMSVASSLGEWCPHGIELMNTGDLRALDDMDWEDMTSPIDCYICT